MTPSDPITSPTGAQLAIAGARFTINGRPRFLLGISYYAGLGAPEQVAADDLRQLRELGLDWVRVWATWDGFGHDVSAVNRDGTAREPFLSRLKALVHEADRLGMVVDVTLTRGSVLADQAAHLQAVATLTEALRPYRNVYVDLGNERDVRDARFVSFGELKALRARVRQIDPQRLVTASSGGDIGEEELRRYLREAQVDFIAPHRPRDAGSPGETLEATRRYLDQMSKLGRPVPVHYQEPFRRDYGSWQPGLEDFRADLRNARSAGAAGWCLHNGDNRHSETGRPRRSFDLRPDEGRLMEQMDSVEILFLREAAALIGSGSDSPR